MAKLAIAHDWLLNARGAERVLAEFCAVLPEISIYTLFLDPETVTETVKRHSVYVSSWDRLPAVRRYYRLLLPFFPRAASTLQVRDVDAMLSISHSVAKAIPRAAGIPHVCYCLTPMRYLWEPQLYGDALNGSLRGWLLRFIADDLKRHDLRSSRSVDHFVAVSRTVQERIQRVYGRSSLVIHPCADLEFFSPADLEREDFYLIVSALVPQKRIDLAIEAFNRSGRKLLIAGSGPLRAALERGAADNIQFLGWRTDEQVRELYRRARALVFPGTEDFGLVPVEAQGCGCPVAAFGEGGLTETVVEGETGLFFAESAADSLNLTLDRLERSSFDPSKIVANAQRFSRSRFRAQWREFFRRLNLDVFG